MPGALVPTGFMPGSMQDRVDGWVRAALAPQGLGFQRDPVWVDARGQYHNSPNAYITGLAPQRSPMASWNFGGGFNGGNGGLSLVSGGTGSWASSGGGGGWSDVFSQGLGVLTGWAQNRAQERAIRRQNRRSMGGGGPYLQPIQNPYMNQNPNLGGAPATPFGFAPNPNLPTTNVPFGWPMLNPQPRGPRSQESYDTGVGILDQILNGITNSGPGDDVSTPVVIDQNGTPCVVRKPPPPRLIGSVNNTTGVAKFYRYVGAPILFRGDLQTLKTAKRAVSKFGGVAGARRPFRARRRR